MKTHLSNSMKRVLSVTAIALVSTGILGCSSINAEPGVTASIRGSASSEKATPLQPGSPEWNYANWGDTGL
jgi:hypothetical protein